METADPNSFQGLRDRFRSAVLIKNRYGICDKVVPMNFFGELGLFRELPKSNEICDYSQYMSLSKTEDINIKDAVKVQNEPKQNNEIHYKF